MTVASARVEAPPAAPARRGRVAVPWLAILALVAACGGEGGEASADGHRHDGAGWADSADGEDAIGDAGADSSDSGEADGTDTGPELSAPEPGGPAMPCDAARPCGAELACVTVAPEHTVGVCSPTCATLHASCGYFGPGVHAECALTTAEGALACGFICVLDHGDHSHEYACPAGDWGRLRCERNPGPFGHRYCAPSQP